MCVLHSCRKDETKVVMNDHKPSLSSDLHAPIVLLQENADKPALTITYDDVNLGFEDALAYKLQVAPAGSGFEAGSLVEVDLDREALSRSFTVKELNTMLIKIVPENVASEMELRIKTSEGNVISNILAITATPYLDVAVPLPTSGNLYITGGATPLGWQAGNGQEPEPASQKFTKTSATTYELTVQLAGNNSYLFIPVYSSWAAKYGFTGKSNENNVTGDTFKENGGDIKSPAEGGLYKIIVDFKTGKFSLTKQ